MPDTYRVSSMRIPETATDEFLRQADYDLIGEYQEAVSLAGFTREEHVLDVGTGTGRMAVVLAQAGYTVLSGDIDSEAIERARARLLECGASGVILFALNAEQMPFDEDAYASIVCANAVHHMTDPAAVISEMARVCKPGGKAVVIEFTDTGFEMIEKTHRHQNREEHDRGVLDSDGIGGKLSVAFTQVQHHKLKLNNVWIAAEKRQTKCR